MHEGEAPREQKGYLKDNPCDLSPPTSASEQRRKSPREDKTPSFAWPGSY